ncbi:MAG TPA: pyridoxamine 5'-phosphate oxidase [Puia sp.]|nr:pyridoxamine 5'-phosphate oxidase [Puia sp.]
MPSIAELRREYSLRTLSEQQAEPDAFDQFGKWWKEVIASEIQEPNAMILATSSADGLPSARVVLLKGFDRHGFVFYTNYNSFKGQQLAENPRACLVFLWKELERQVRITGLVEKVSGKESDEYFNGRPELSRIAAWASPQSQVITSRNWLDENEKKYESQFKDQNIGRPPHWGGYRVMPTDIEFWQGRPNRLHDRLNYSLSENGEWKIERLAP